MRHELWYTSAPRGLYLGSSGYCTVKATRGLPPLLRDALERLSQYQHVYPPGNARANENPAVISCMTATIGGAKWRILSRVCDAGADHTNRTNFFAHHIAYDASEGPRDPAWLACQPTTFEQQWDHRTEELTVGRDLPKGTETLHSCAAWQAVCGDAGWAGAVADALLENSAVYIVSNGSRSVLPLINEVASLLPVNKRAELTFSTQYQGSSGSTNCQLRCVSPGSEEAKRAAASRLPIFDLAAVPDSTPPDSLRVNVARTGIWHEMLRENHPKSDGTLPETFISSAKVAPAPAGGSRATIPKTKRLEPVPNRATFRGTDSAGDSDASRAWLPVLSGIGGLALCALVLTPLIFWYRAENQSQKGSVAQLNEKIAVTNTELNKQKEENAATEKDRDSLQKKLSVSEHDSKMAQIKSDQQINETKTQVEQLKHDNDDLKRQLADAKDASKKTPADVASPPKSEPAPPPATNPKPSIPAAQQRTIARIPDAGVVARLIDLVPSRPKKIEIVGAHDFRVIPKQDQWDIQKGDSIVAVLKLVSEPQSSLRFVWSRGGNRSEPLTAIHDELSHASLHLTLENSDVIVVPLFYTLAPTKQ